MNDQQQPIRITGSNVAEVQDLLVITGFVHPDDLLLLQFGDYQRETLHNDNEAELIESFMEGKVVQAIDLGLRVGGKTKTAKGNVELLYGDVYVMDGRQRVAAAIAAMEKGTIYPPQIPVIVFIDTTEQWERERFWEANGHRTRVASNVFLYNWTHDHEVVKVIQQLTQESSFALAGRVTWKQTPKPHELVTARNLVLTAAHLHSHFIRGLKTVQVDDVLLPLQRVMDHIGRDMFVDNLITFFDLVDEAYGVRAIKTRRGSAQHLAGAFLFALGLVLSEHNVFWRDNDTRLFIDIDWRRKFRAFDIHDREVRDLMKSSGGATRALYNRLTRHLDSGRTVNFLQRRQGKVGIPKEEDS